MYLLASFGGHGPLPLPSSHYESAFEQKQQNVCFVIPFTNEVYNYASIVVVAASIASEIIIYITSVVFTIIQRSRQSFKLAREN